ncbi:unnamed protein product [Didymodactylos carnosus]|uniref:DH domain-containing protein n=1 Tax=Didymodactylos carnosus TaxID=1234261 RepID=A0A8S2FN27_9BILA|nr:unnamed protein product [Didymodactylos carnosus]CAF4305607.1 unnamed protein product [Didymodactylos carnosus]
MIELRLDGFLLAPIQRICQYPLQLNELLKYTSTDHSDYENVVQALNAMRDVAVFINERKRRMEYIEVIHKWQYTVQGWMGKNLLETSTQGLGRADAYHIINGKKESITLFLFDHVLILCKKDRKNLLVYYDRADLDNCEIENLDGKENDNLLNNLYTWRLHDHTQLKTFLFSHKTQLDKIQMLDAFVYERALVQENLSKDRSISAILKTSSTINNSLLNSSIYSSGSHSTSTTNTTTNQHRFIITRKSSLPRFIRPKEIEQQPNSDDSIRLKSRFRFW